MWQCVLEPATSGGSGEARVGSVGAPHPPTHWPTRGGLVAFQLLEATPPAPLFPSLSFLNPPLWNTLSFSISISTLNLPTDKVFFPLFPSILFPPSFPPSFLLLVFSLPLPSNLGEVGIRQETVEGSEVIPADLFLWTRQDAGRIKKEGKQKRKTKRETKKKKNQVKQRSWLVAGGESCCCWFFLLLLLFPIIEMQTRVWLLSC